MPTTRRKRLASAVEAAEHIGVNHRTIRRWITTGVITGYRVGPKLIKVDLDELDRLVRPVAAPGDVG
jgi:excisionase family DNA binding protein